MTETQLHELDFADSTVEAVGDDFITEVIRRKLAEARVLIEKQEAYGPYNIARPPNGITPEVALVVRINDKVQRLGTLLTAGNANPTGSEARSDTWGDGANYFTIGGMLEDGKWPGMDLGNRQGEEPEDSLPGEYPAAHVPPQPVIYVGDHVVDVFGNTATVEEASGDHYKIRYPWSVVEAQQVFREDKNRWYLETTYENRRERILGFDA